jgi:hypothetical protein
MRTIQAGEADYLSCSLCPILGEQQTKTNEYEKIPIITERDNVLRISSFFCRRHGVAKRKHRCNMQHWVHSSYFVSTADVSGERIKAK